jgi:hypothetical protein
MLILYLWKVSLAEDYEQTCFATAAISNDNLSSPSARVHKGNGSGESTNFFTKSTVQVSKQTYQEIEVPGFSQRGCWLTFVAM